MRPRWRPNQVLILLAILLLSRQTSAFESLVHAQNEVRKDLTVAPLPFALPDWRLYHRTDHLQTQILALAHNCTHAKVTTHVAHPADPLPAYPSNTGIPPVTANDGLLYVTLRAPKKSPFADGLLQRMRSMTTTHRQSPRPPIRVVFVFGEEGRDLLTSEIALRVLRNVCDHAQRPQQSATETSSHASDDVQTMLAAGVELVLVPVANPDGRRIAEMGRRCDRANARDVDVDRNWPSFWGAGRGGVAMDGVEGRDAGAEGSKQGKGSLRAAVARRLTPRDETPRDIPAAAGAHPFSEPESRALSELVAKLRPASYVAVRTGALALTVPWDCKPALLPNWQEQRLRRVVEPVAAGHCTKCRLGSLWNVTGRVKCGTGTDYVFGTLGVPFVHKWHVYDVQAPRGDCFRRHNPVSKAAYERVTQNWANAVLNYSQAVLNWVTLEESEGAHVAEQNASLSAAEASERRVSALARGATDPEEAESESTTADNSKSSHVSGDASDQGNRQQSENGAPFSWMFNERRAEEMTNDGRTKQPYVIGPRPRMQASSANQQSNGSILMGWWGVWAALFLMAAGFYIAKRYVFHLGPRKRSRFLSRAYVKHA